MLRGSEKLLFLPPFLLLFLLPSAVNNKEVKYLYYFTSVMFLGGHMEIVRLRNSYFIGSTLPIQILFSFFQRTFYMLLCFII